jgi:hypothetical protein
MLGPISLSGLTNLGNNLDGLKAALEDRLKGREYAICDCGGVACILRQAMREKIEFQMEAGPFAPADLTPGKLYPVQGVEKAEDDDPEDSLVSVTDDDGVRFRGQFRYMETPDDKNDRPFTLRHEALEELKGRLEAHFAKKRERDGVMVNTPDNDHLQRDRDHYQLLLDVVSFQNEKCPFEQNALIKVRENMNSNARPSHDGFLHIVLDNTVRGFMSTGEPFDMIIAMIDADGERMIFNANSARYQRVSDERVVAIISESKE